jgi:hypothetical protein
MFSALSAESVEQLNSCDYVLLPGATILADAPGQGEAMSDLGRITVPVFCVAAGGWEPMPYNEKALRLITPPLGVRDLKTLAVCERLGIPAMMVGCPTAYLPKREAPEIGSVVGFARRHWAWQGEMLKQYCDATTLAACQECVPISYEDEIISVLGVKKFRYDDPSAVIQTYASATRVVTGRLHGVLPAMSQKKPVAFFGDLADSRFTLLQHLGVPVHPIGASMQLAFAMPEEYEGRVAATESVYREWAELTVSRFA